MVDLIRFWFRVGKKNGDFYDVPYKIMVSYWICLAYSGGNRFFVLNNKNDVYKRVRHTTPCGFFVFLEKIKDRYV